MELTTQKLCSSGIESHNGESCFCQDLCYLGLQRGVVMVSIIENGGRK